MKPPLTLFDLPYTAWDRVAFFISAADDVDTLLRLSSMSRDLQAICRPHTSTHFRRAPFGRLANYKWLLSEHGKPAWANHAFTHLVLNGDVDPTKVLEYACTDQYGDYHSEYENYRHRFSPTPTTRPGLPRPGFEQVSEAVVRQYDCLVRKAIEASRWISPDMREDVFERFRTGDKDAAGVILLPLLTRLKAVEPPIKGGLCASLFQRIAHESHDLAMQAQTPPGGNLDVSKLDVTGEVSRLPFSELLIFFVEADEKDGHQVTFWLRYIRPFLSIRSLRRIVLTGVRDWELDEWPSDQLPISCPEIYFARSSVNRDTIMKFSENIAGPCTLMQWLSYDCYYSPQDSMGNEATWDHLRVDVDSSGKRRAWTSLECDGGASVEENPWVSWLYHGRMRDWELLEEPFHGQEGDSDNEDFFSP
jgi:hypothetical protein